MKNITCEYCKTNIEASFSLCPNCSYPIKGDVSEKSAFRMKLIDVKFWIQGLESPRNLSRILGTIYIIGGLLLCLMLFDVYPIGAVTCFAIGAVYFGIFFWSTKDKYTPFVFAPVFYFIHTGIELILDLLPYNILPISIENGWFGFVPIVVSILPYLYAVFRICLIVVFVKGFINVRKIRNNPKLVDQYMKRFA